MPAYKQSALGVESARSMHNHARKLLESAEELRLIAAETDSLVASRLHKVASDLLGLAEEMSRDAGTLAKRLY